MDMDCPPEEIPFHKDSLIAIWEMEKARAQSHSGLQEAALPSRCLKMDSIARSLICLVKDSRLRPDCAILQTAMLQTLHDTHCKLVHGEKKAGHVPILLTAKNLSRLSKVC